MDMTKTRNSFGFRSTPNAAAILAGFTFPPTELSETERSEWKAVLFDSIITEYDARRLYWHLKSKNQDYFPRLADVLNPWLKDEIDHAYGFALIYTSFTGISLDEVVLEAEIRNFHFNTINPIISDAFKLLVTLAYDEIITTHVYHRSIKKYDSFNSQQLSSWIRKTKKDEVTHFFSFVQKAKDLFPHRNDEVPSILEEIFRIDFNKKTILEHSF